MVQTAFIPPELRDLRRKVALAYREAKIAGSDEQACHLCAFAVFAEAEPERAAADRSAASLEVNTMIATAIAADPEWFWRPLKERMAR